MAKISLAGIAAALRAADSFLIASHPNPDGDAIGSILAASQSALSGWGWNSRKRPSMPTPQAARANGKM